MQRAGEALSVMILCLSAVLAWRLGFSLGASDVEKHILALISVSLEGWKVLLPFVILAAWRDKRIVALGLALTLWPLLTAYSFVGGLGFSELNRAALAGTRGASSDRAATFKADIADITSRLTAIPTKRSPDEIEAAITMRRQTPIRTGNETKALSIASDACKTIVSKRSTDLCAEIGTLTQELAQAHERVRLEARLATLREQLSQVSALDWDGVADPQISAVAAITGLDATTTRRIINVGFAALLELVGGLGLFFSSLLRETRPDTRRPVATANASNDTVTPESDEDRLGRYLGICTEADSTSTIVASKLHTDYSRWAHDDGATPVSLTTFGNLIAKRGIAKQKVDGLMHYQGLAFKSAERIAA